jgi:hypothetical protein
MDHENTKSAQLWDDCPLYHGNAIVITEAEMEVFMLVKNVSKHFSLNTTIRVAGGWVRDKLLGKQTNDMDLALDNMTGEQFSKRINEYIAAEDTKESDAKFR